MKIQDIFFFIVLAIFLWKRNPQWAAAIGLMSLVGAIPLFATWTFFTAERLTWYAGVFFLLSILFHLWEQKK